MKVCPKCSKEHEMKGRYCSRSCSNSRVFSDDSRKKKSDALRGRKTTRSPNSINHEARISKVKETWKQKYIDTPFDELGSHNKRRRVFEEQGYKCAHCGLSEWIGSPISLELDHVDGNNQNNLRDNLEGLCPNCHSMTETWRGRNKPVRNGNVDVSDEFLLECIHSTPNIRQALLKAGLSAKGANYNRAKNLLN